MKAILVVDIPDKLDYLHLYLEGRILYTDKNDIGFKFLKELSLCALKPMPQKRILPKEQVEGTNYGEEPWFSDGYNACIDDILGDTE